MFKKLLIANRGEVAARVARTAKRLGMETIAVYSEVERDAVHCHACDEAVLIGPAALSESYANVEAVMRAAVACGADAIHPGYGLLSESDVLARAAQAANIAFIGPPPELIARMLNRLEARKLAIAAGVRVLPGTDDEVKGVADARERAKELEYPVVVKPVRAGRKALPISVHHEDDLEEALNTVVEEAERVYGDGRVYLERAARRPRLVEVQILADNHGDVIAVGERECSVQRGSLRLVDESPAPALSGSGHGDRMREAIWDAAVRIGKEAEYRGAGSVEFLLDENREPYFLELRPRLSVAHGITEMCTGIDLVEAQLLVAAGSPVPEEVARAMPSGHALEVRLWAEHINRGFAPATGDVTDVRWPNASPGRMRIESTVQPGSRVTSDYDPDLAKIITHAPTRHAALLMMDRVLAECAVTPLPTNAAFLRRILGHEAFRAGQYDVSLVEQILKK
jgi:acetyl/propionyl-CoA carboxylase alpha subunit